MRSAQKNRFARFFPRGVSKRSGWPFAVFDRVMKPSRLFALICGLALGSTATAADLLQVYRAALDKDARIAAARAERLAGQEKQIQARAGLLPSIDAAVATSWNDARINRRDVGYNTNSWSVNLTQPLFRWQNWVQAEQGQLQSALADVQFEIARQTLALNVAEAYFGVLNARDALDALLSLREAAAQQLELAQKSFEVGTTTITDVHEARSRFDLANAQVIAAESELEIRREMLARLTGEPPTELAGLRPGVGVGRPQPERVEDWIAAAQEGALAVQAQQLGTSLAEREVERSRAGHLPTLDLVASHGNTTTGFSNAGIPVDTDATVVGLQLRLPLYQGGATASREREALALRDKARADLDDVRRGATLAVRQAYLGVSSGLAQVAALEAAERSSLSSLEANQLGYEVGVRINIDVLNAQSQLADARQRLAKARYDTLLAQLRLKAAAGRLSEDDLAELNALLQH